MNCRGQIPTFSPSLASIQCSSKRLMTVRTSPCKTQIINRPKTSFGGSGKKVRGLKPAEKTNKLDARCFQQSALALKTEHSESLYVTPAACDIHCLCVSRPGPFYGQPHSKNHLTICIKASKQVCFNGEHTSTEAFI